MALKSFRPIPMLRNTRRSTDAYDHRSSVWHPFLSLFTWLFLPLYLYLESKCRSRSRFF